MAGLAHLGVGLAAKRWAPEVNVGILIVGAYAIDFICFGFIAMGLEHFPDPEVMTTAPYSHGVFTGVFWSLLAGGVAALVTRNRRSAAVIGLVVYSHWVLDFITQPMTALFPNSGSPPLWFGDSPMVGLGLYRTQLGANIGEYGTLAVGLAIYVLTRLQLRRKRLVGAEGMGTER
jgi:hypothetical protein